MERPRPVGCYCQLLPFVRRIHPEQAQVLLSFASASCPTLLPSAPDFASSPCSPCSHRACWIQPPLRQLRRRLTRITCRTRVSAPTHRVPSPDGPTRPESPPVISTGSAVFRIRSMTHNMATHRHLLKRQAAAYRSYRVESSPSLAVGSWQAVEGLENIPNGSKARELAVEIPTGEKPQQFYRITPIPQ